MIMQDLKMEISPNNSLDQPSSRTSFALRLFSTVSNDHNLTGNLTPREPSG